jgi:hypothetical protein
MSKLFVMDQEPDVLIPTSGECIVALKDTKGKFSLYVEAFTLGDKGPVLKHTTRKDEAARYPRFEAEDIVETVKEFRCTGRVEAP